MSNEVLARRIVIGLEYINGIHAMQESRQLILTVKSCITTRDDLRINNDWTY
jgi:hypothetical protein